MDERAELIVRRLEDMEIVHCWRCQEPCGLFAGGQALLREQPLLRFVCSVCQPVQSTDILIQEPNPDD